MFKYKEPTMAHDLNDDQITTYQHGQHVKERSDCYQITSSSRMRVIYHNWSATKQRLI